MAKAGGDCIDRLFETEANPAPAGSICGVTRASDGIGLRYARWRTSLPPCRGTILLLQGRAEYIEKNYETVFDLLAAGYDVLAFDWRGQGGSSRMLSDRRRGYVDSFDDYVTDLETIVANIALPDCRGPFFILAHSTGSLVALLAAPGFGNRIERMILSSPFLGFGTMPVSPGALAGVTGVLCAFGLGWAQLSKGSGGDATIRFAGNRLTSDLRRFTRNMEFVSAHPSIALGTPTAAWLRAAGVAMEQAGDSDFMGSIIVPSLLVASGNDQVVSVRAIEEYGRRLRSGHAVLVAGAKHELLQERDFYREQLLAALFAFAPGERAPHHRGARETG